MDSTRSVSLPTDRTGFLPCFAILESSATGKKIESAVSNARAFLGIRETFGSFSAYLWGFVDGKPVVNEWKEMTEVPAKTDLSETISRDMKSRGFSFFGPVACYAFLQSAGVVNDHLVSCFRHREVQFL